MIETSDIELNKRVTKLQSDLIKVREEISRGLYSSTNVIAITLMAVFGCLLLIGTIIFTYKDSTYSIFDKANFKTVMPFCIVYVLFCVIIAPRIFLSDIKKRESIIIGQLASIGAETLQAKIEEDFFTNLVKINFKYIDQYYLQTQIQAGNSFAISMVAAVTAFVIIIVGIILMYFGKTQSAYVATGSGLLSEFIAAVFFYLYNKSIVKMSEYHHKLVLTQNISLALKITEQMPEQQKIQAQQKIIKELTKNINQHLASKFDNLE